jgi:hypothetical protein
MWTCNSSEYEETHHKIVTDPKQLLQRRINGAIRNDKVNKSNCLLEGDAM